MKRKALYIPFIIFSLAIFSSVSTYAVAVDADDFVWIVRSVSISVNAPILAVVPDLSLDPASSSELNALIDEILIQRLTAIVDFIIGYLMIAWAFFLTWPVAIRTVVFISLFPAIIGILTSHVLGIYRNRNEWFKHPEQKLMFSYFIKSGTRQRKMSYTSARTLLYDHKWFIVSFAGLAFRLGNFSDKSKMLTFVLSIVYLPLAIMGIIEMILRTVLGTIWLFCANMAHRLLLLGTKLISYLAIPLVMAVDKVFRKVQYCPHCFDTFTLPEFTCPKCRAVHNQLIPSRCGALFVRCGCNNTFLPCTAFTGRSQLAAFCPACKGDLVAANAKQFSIQLVGGASAGKTAYLAAFQHLYIEHANTKDNLAVYGKPTELFHGLESMYMSGFSEATSGGTSQTYSIVHKYGKRASDNLVIYDIPGEVIIDGSYSRNPKNFGFCDGLIFIVDPLSIQAVRDDCVTEGESEALVNYSHDDVDTVIVQFINQFAKIKGLSAKRMSDIPVAVIISKVDVKVIKREVGAPKIRALFNKNQSAYGGSESIARDTICKAYLSKLGLDNALNNIDATFSNVRYFPVSAMGRINGEGMPYDPVGVIEPIAWIAKEGRSNTSQLFNIETRELQTTY
jgi:hypothetical protein